MPLEDIVLGKRDETLHTFPLIGDQKMLADELGIKYGIIEDCTRLFDEQEYGIAVPYR
jgi:hypothetical protein